MRYLNIKNLPNLLFIVCFVVSAGVIGFQNVINLAPQSIHYWRQADCTSQTLNFYKDGMDFFSPRIHNMGWTIDGHAAGEFPILYYITAFLYQILGQHEWILRGLNLLFYFVGLWALFRLAWHLTSQLVVSLCYALLFLASPILAFYGVNYLPNVPALSLVFLSWLCFYYFIDNQRIRWFYACNGALLFAALLKPTTLVIWVAIGAVWLFEILRGVITKKKSIVFSKPLAVIPAFLMVLIPFVMWRVWADNYNKIHDTGYYFLRTIMPIWDMKPDDRHHTFKHLQNFALQTWFAEPTLWVIVGIILFNFIMVKKQNRLLFALFSLVFVGIVTYFFSFFIQFTVHDYYATDLFALAAISLLLFLYFLKTNYPTVLEKPLVQALFIAFFIYNLAYTRQDFRARYDLNSEKYGQHNNFPLAHFDIQRIRQFINTQTPISEKDTIISLPDISPNATLYYYDRRGYTFWNFGPTTVWSQDWMRLMIQNHHCKYLIVNDLHSNQLDSIRPFLTHPLAQLDSTIFVYDMKELVHQAQ